MIARIPRGVPAALAAAVFFAAGWAVVRAGEHPEHPTEPPAKPKEAETPPAPMTMEDLSKAIRAYVEKDSALKGGLFLVYDSVDKAPLVLTLDKVHEEKLASLGNEVYFACVDMKHSDGTVYDLDIFMKRQGKNPKPTEITVHKKGGAARYNWQEEGGVWKKVPLEGGGEGAGAAGAGGAVAADKCDKCGMAFVEGKCPMCDK